MQSKINNDKNTNYNKLNYEIDKNEVLMNNKEIINSLILENSQKKDKSFISIKELEIIREYETNLIKLLENCPPKIIKKIFAETSTIEEIEPNKNNSVNNSDL